MSSAAILTAKMISTCLGLPEPPQEVGGGGQPSLLLPTTHLQKISYRPSSWIEVAVQREAALSQKCGNNNRNPTDG